VLTVDVRCGVEIQQKFRDVTLHTSTEVLTSELKLEVGIPVGPKLKLKKRLENGLEMGLPKGPSLRHVFYNCSKEVVWE